MCKVVSASKDIQLSSQPLPPLSSSPLSFLQPGTQYVIQNSRFSYLFTPNASLSLKKVVNKEKFGGLEERKRLYQKTVILRWHACVYSVTLNTACSFHL